MTTEVENLRLRIAHRDEEILQLRRLVAAKNLEIDALKASVEAHHHGLVRERIRSRMIERIASDDRIAMQRMNERVREAVDA